VKLRRDCNPIRAKKIIVALVWIVAGQRGMWGEGQRCAVFAEGGLSIWRDGSDPIGYISLTGQVHHQ
jgi:hypothetical protein